MKTYRRILAFSAALLMTAASMSACKKKQEDKDYGDVLLDGYDVPGVERGAFEGREVNFYIALSTCKPSYIAEEETGNEKNDAVYLRNARTRAWTGADITFTGTTRTSSGTDQGAESDFIRTMIMSGDDTYQVYVHVQHGQMPNLIREGYFVDWNTVPHINLDNEWWYSNVKRDICFGDKVYCMTGDYNLDSFANTECLMFNKDMMDELELEYPYQMVKDGTWTHDKFVEYIKKATADLNADGKMTYADDQYGFAGWQYEQIPALFCGYGGECLVKDEMNLPVLNIDTPKTATVVTKMLEVFDLPGSAYIGTQDGSGLDNKMFEEGRLLFNDSFFNHVEASRKIEDFEIGFVPYPKLDTDQKEYYSRTANVSGLTYIPVSNADLDATGAVLEALAYFSGDTILDNYFDIILTVKSTRDTESEEMIPIIRNSSRFLDCYIGFTGSNFVTSGANTMGSYVSQNRDNWNLTINALREFYSK